MTKIDPAQWKEFAGRFSKEHDGWGASLQIRQSEGGVEVEVEDLPFRGLTFEKREDRETLILTFGDDPDEHLAHIIERPRELSVLGAGSEECSLIIGLDDGSGCILELVNPFNVN
jgi:hypothetical protein